MKKKQCLNCNTPVNGHFCSNCGQDTHTRYNPKLHDLFHELIHEFLHLDGKIFRSIRVLLLKPGQLTRELLQGKKVRSIGPIRLYLAISLSYFLINSFFHFQNSSIKVHLANDPTTASLQNSQQYTPTEKYIVSLAKKIESSPEKFETTLKKTFPKIFFFLVPFFAFLLQWSFRQKRLNYPIYLYFSLHLHSTVFLILLLTLPINFFFDPSAIVALGFIFYFYKSLKYAFNEPRLKSFLRVAIISFLYFWSFLFALFALIGISALKL